MSFIAVGVGVAGVAASVYAAKSASDAQKKAANKQAKNVAKTNELNYQMFREARGEGGSAVMPLYMRNEDGSLFEKGLSDKFISDWDSLTSSVTPEGFRAVSDRSAQSRQAASDAADSLFDGRTEQQQLSNFAPVKQARVAFRRQAAMDSLNKTLGEINALQAGKGFTGDSMGDRLLKFKARKVAGDDMGMVNLQNVEEERGIRDAALRDRMNAVNLPFQMQRNEIGAWRMPQDEYIDMVLKGLQPMSFLRMGGSQPFKYEGPPPVVPVAGTGQIIGQTVATGANTALNAYLQNKEANAWRDLLKQQQQQQQPQVQVPQTPPPSTYNQQDAMLKSYYTGGG